MKNILAVTASLKRCSVAIRYNDKLYEINENADAATNLVFLADELCKANNIDIKKLSGVITVSGPGSFTGIRVAQSFAKGIALACKIPSVSIDYFEVIRKMYDKDCKDLVGVIKSEKNQAYYKLFDSGEVGVASYEKLLQLFPQDFIAIGEEVPIISDLNFKEIKDFRDAKNLLQFENLLGENSSVSPLYINAKSQ